MTFKEFSKKCEISLRDAVIEILIQPKGTLTLTDKLNYLADVIIAYAEKYEEITGIQPLIKDIMEAIKRD